MLAAAVVLVGMALLAMPHLHGQVLDHVHKEDGTVFLTDFLRTGWSSVWQSYSGYLHVPARLIAGGCATWAPPETYDVCVGASSIGLRGVFALIAMAALAPYARGPHWAIAAGALFVWVPVGQQEALGNVTNLRWFIDAFLVVVLLGCFRGFAAVVVAALVLVVTPSDPLVVLLVPLALWRLRTLSGSGRLVPGAFVAGVAALAVFLRPGDRGADPALFVRRPLEMAEQVLVRGPLVAQFGQNGTEMGLLTVGLPVLLVALLLPLAVLGWGAHSADRDLRLLAAGLVGGGVLLVAGTLVFADLDAIGLANWWAVGQASRYSVAPALLIGMALILLAGEALTGSVLARGLAVASLALLATAYASDWPGDPANTKGPLWADTVAEARTSCETRPADPDRPRRGPTVTVPVTPQGVSIPWTATLPCSWLE